MSVRNGKFKIPGFLCLVSLLFGCLVIPCAAEEEFPAMTTYYLVMLIKGPNRGQSTEEAEQIQKQHIAHLESMGKAGKMVLAGPLTDDGFIRGLCVYKVETLAEAKSLAEQDPAVKSGRLAVEVHPWLVQKGILP